MYSRGFSRGLSLAPWYYDWVIQEKKSIKKVFVISVDFDIYQNIKYINILVDNSYPWAFLKISEVIIDLKTYFFKLEHAFGHYTSASEKSKAVRV